MGWYQYYQYYCCISDVVRLQDKEVRLIVTICMKLLPDARSIMVSWDNHWMRWNMPSNMNNNKILIVFNSRNQIKCHNFAWNLTFPVTRTIPSFSWERSAPEKLPEAPKKRSQQKQKSELDKNGKNKFLLL